MYLQKHFRKIHNVCKSYKFHFTSVELFADIKMAGKELKTLEILQKFKEQAMAKVSVLEGKQQ